MFFLGGLKIHYTTFRITGSYIRTASLTILFSSVSAALSIANLATFFAQIKPLFNHCDNESLHTVELEASLPLLRKWFFLDGMI
jgi:hypothetical protein